MKNKRKAKIEDVLNTISELSRRSGEKGDTAIFVHQVNALQSIIGSTINGVYPSLQEAIDIRYKNIKAEVDELKPIRKPWSSGMEDEMLANADRWH
jgi:hypothetical protein